MLLAVAFHEVNPTHTFLYYTYLKAMAASAWIQFVKANHKKHGGSYSDALKRSAPLWRKQKGGKGASAPEEKKKPKRKRRKR